MKDTMQVVRQLPPSHPNPRSPPLPGPNDVENLHSLSPVRIPKEIHLGITPPPQIRRRQLVAAVVPRIAADEPEGVHVVR
jgi:hypothetical protein